MIAFIVRVHHAADGLAGVVEFPGSSRTPFRSGADLVALVESWLHDTAAAPGPSETAGSS